MEPAGFSRLPNSGSAVCRPDAEAVKIVWCWARIYDRGGDLLLLVATWGTRRRCDTQASVTATISAASIRTGNRARDRDARARFLHTGQYPDITFQAGTLSRA
jgi:hypothetical protein